MSDYTSFRFKGLVKEEYRSSIQELLETKSWGSCNDSLFKSFSKVSRSDMIPFSFNTIELPDEWMNKIKDSKGEVSYEATDNFGLYFNSETGFWCFECALVNYDSTIEEFLYQVVQKICSDLFHCEVLLPYYASSDFYELRDDKVYHAGFGIKYKEPDYPFLGIVPSKDIEYKDFDFSKGENYR